MSDLKLERFEIWYKKWARVRGEVQFYSKTTPQFLRHKLRHIRRIKNWFILRTKCHGLCVIFLYALVYTFKNIGHDT